MSSRWTLLFSRPSSRAISLTPRALALRARSSIKVKPLTRVLSMSGPSGGLRAGIERLDAIRASRIALRILEYRSIYWNEGHVKRRCRWMDNDDCNYIESARRKAMTGIQPLRHFIAEMTALADTGLAEAAMLARARPLMAALLSKDDWLPSAFAEPDERGYRQYLLHCDPRERFSLVSFVWGPGQKTPIHDHTVWGILGVLRGLEVSQRYVLGDGNLHESGATETLEAGAIDMVSPAIGDIHKVWNGSKSKASVSLHLYGGNIGTIRRHSFETNGAVSTFQSGYSSGVIPNARSV